MEITDELFENLWNIVIPEEEKPLFLKEYEKNLSKINK